MNKQKTFLMLIITVTFLSLSAQESPLEEHEFEFKLVAPEQIELTVNVNDEIPVEISFNEDAVNSVSGWILTRVNGKMSGFTAATTMESPFTDEIPAMYLGEGTHLVEYLLLPPGQKTDNPFALISLNITVAAGQQNNAKLIENISDGILQSIRNNDIESFTGYCITEERLNNLVEGITGDTDKDKGVKSELETFDPSEILDAAADNYQKLQEEVSNNNSDIVNTEFVGFVERDINLEMPGFSAMDIGFRIKIDSVSYTIRLNAFIAGEDIYIFDFAYSNM